jgi:hypothetical protein
VNVIVLVECREAIPVRAIPLLTNWQVMSPDEIASALAHEENYENFYGMDAYSLENGEVTPIPATWWERFPCRHLKAISERLKATEISHAVGYQSWTEESQLVLPAGAFVWKDEFEMCYQKVYGPSGWKIWSTHVAVPFEINEVIEGEERVLTREEKEIERKERVRKRKERASEREERVRKHVLNFNPFIPKNQIAMVMEGFELQQTGSQPQAMPSELDLDRVTISPADVTTARASNGAEPDKTRPAIPLQRTAAQDSAILCEIKKQGYDPLALPRNPLGKPGVKAAIRNALSKNLLFTGETVFNKAWERLTARADIAIQG